MSTASYTTSFVLEQVSGTHNLGSDVLKIALFSNTAALSSATTEYSTTGEVTNGNGYTAGGATISVSATYPKTENGLASVRIETVSWTFSANTSIRYALIYNTSQSNKSIMIFDFGTERVYFGSFSLSFPLSQPALFNVAAPT